MTSNKKVDVVVMEFQVTVVTQSDKMALREKNRKTTNIDRIRKNKNNGE